MCIRDRGYRIESRTNKGYFLVEQPHQILKEEIEHSLHTKRLGHPLCLMESVQSTNTLVRQQAEQGQQEGYTLIALEQTEGRGRKGRTFSSPQGGIYMSVLLRPQIRVQEDVYKRQEQKNVQMICFQAPENPIYGREDMLF